MLYNYNAKVTIKYIKSQFTKKKILRNILIFFVLFLIVNIWFYRVEYKRYVTYAPVNLKEARKDYVNAIMFQFYYVLLVNKIRIDFQNPILSPLVRGRDYFYHRSLNKLPKNDAERALWFYLFEVMPYNYSVRGASGSMAKHYGYKFAKKFVDDLYKNIKIFSLYEISDKKTLDIYDESFKAYVNMVSLYIYEFHLNKNGYLFRDENIEKVASDYTLFQKFDNLYVWYSKVAWRYKKEDSKQFNRVVNIKNGWYSPYTRYYENVYIISSFILTYKINNNIFNCEQDKKYFKSKDWAAKGIKKILKTFPHDSYQSKVTYQMFRYLYIVKSYRVSQPKSLHPLKLKTDCKPTKSY